MDAAACSGLHIRRGQALCLKLPRHGQGRTLFFISEIFKQSSTRRQTLRHSLFSPFCMLLAYRIV
jgi:hypothetical protein